MEATSWMERVGQWPTQTKNYFEELKQEMRRVTWPGLKEVQNTTIITVIAVIFFAVYLFAVDQALSRLVLGLDWLLEKIARFLGLA